MAWADFDNRYSLTRYFPSGMAWSSCKYRLKRNCPQEWPGLISGIENQGWCSSSWALATAAVAGDRFLALMLLHILIITITIIITMIVVIITFSITIIAIIAMSCTTIIIISIGIKILHRQSLKVPQ